MSGAPPHLDIFDYKPELQKHDGKPCPDEYLKGKRFAFTSGVPKLLGTRQPFKQYGKAGIWMSDAIKPLHEVADDVTVIRSMKTDEFNHAPAELLLYTGFARAGRPSFGAWTCYGLGNESENLPGFVVLISSGVQPSGGQGCWGSGFLPSVFQGVQCRSKGEPVLYLSDPPGLDRDMRRLGLDAMKDLNELQEKELGHPETRTRISQYELAFRMQLSGKRSHGHLEGTAQKVALTHYGAKPGAGSFANNCLLARQLHFQAGRSVLRATLRLGLQDFHGTNGPGEDNSRRPLPRRAPRRLSPSRRLIKDLKDRGLLDRDTLIILGR